MSTHLVQPNTLLGMPAFPASGYAGLADRLKSLLSTNADLVFVQAEAIIALEAAAHSLARPGLVAVNIVTSPYGRYFGEWLRRAGATVHDVIADVGRPIKVSEVFEALATLPQIDLFAVVHAETSTGILNPLPQIAEFVRARGALLVVDAVASVGGHELNVDKLGIDVCVIGPQKALGGPAGLSAVTVSSRAWEAMAQATKPSPSTLNLLDLKSGWVDRGRGVVPGMPSAIEFWALEAALQRIEAETISAVIARHELAGRATRAGLRGLGLKTWVEIETEASALATTVVVPDGIDAAQVISKAVLLGVGVSPSHGNLGARLLRLDHTAARANLVSVLGNVVGLGLVLENLGIAVDIGAGAGAVAQIYGHGLK